MSQENLKEVEIVTQRIDNGQETHAKGTAKGTDDAPVPVSPPGEIKSSEQADGNNDLAPSGNRGTQGGSKGQSLNVPGANQSGAIPRASIDQGALPTEKKDEFDIFKVEDEGPKQRFPLLLAFLDSFWFQAYILVCTIYALFASDVRIMTSNVNADSGFDVVTIIVMSSFTLELLLSILVREDYIFSFFFWLDMISTVSILLDIQMFSNSVFYGGSTGGNKSTSSQLARAGRASRVGTRAGRVVRLVRLIRIVKLYKAASDDTSDNGKETLAKLMAARKNKKVHPSKKGGKDNSGNGQNRVSISGEDQDVVNSGPGQPASPRLTNREDGQQTISADNSGRPLSDNPVSNMPKESRVSKRLSDLTTKRVIVIVLILLFIMPLFSADYFFDPPDSMDFSMKQLAAMSIEKTTHEEMKGLFDKIIDIHSKQNIKTPISFLSVPMSYIDNFESEDFVKLRPDEQGAQTASLDIDAYEAAHPEEVEEVAYLRSLGEGKANFLGILNKRPTNIIMAGLGIGNTIFISLVLTLAALSFSKDAQELALAPLERMIDKVNMIAKNPLSAKELKLEKQQEGEEELETIVIENAIIKIGSLLALGFGDAGSEIIAMNMAKSGDVDPMIPGVKKCAIYGFCDIRNFTDATEQLQEDVMLFVNNIGEVVHTMVDRYAGAANKNIGDAFLLVWKIPKEKYDINEEDNSVTFKDQRYIQILSDFALISFMKLQAKMNREPKCLAYRKDQRLLNRIPGYKVKMGLGLHQGWGIEGAIGSEFKIDASYLSPNVNMAARLEGGTKMYGVPMLITHDLHDLFTTQMKRYTRFVDRVLTKGQTKPIGLYTVDMECDHLPPSKDQSYYESQGMTRTDRQEFERLKKLDMQMYLTNPDEYHWSAEEHISTNKDLRLMMERWNEKFQNTFAEGFQLYLNGDWTAAKQKFEDGLKLAPEDGPTKTLMEYMAETNYKTPNDWTGARENYGL